MVEMPNREASHGQGERYVCEVMCMVRTFSVKHQRAANLMPLKHITQLFQLRDSPQHFGCRDLILSHDFTI